MTPHDDRRKYPAWAKAKEDEESMKDLPEEKLRILLHMFQNKLLHKRAQLCTR